MKKFEIFEHPDGKTQVVKDGFSWPGFLFSGFWLLYHRMWSLGSLALGVGLVVFIIFPSPAGYFMGVPFGHRIGAAEAINVFIEVWIGIQGNSWRIKTLPKRGFQHVGTVEAETADGARAAHILGQSLPPVSDPFSGDKPLF